jgi:hypothetical protein
VYWKDSSLLSVFKNLIIKMRKSLYAFNALMRKLPNSKKCAKNQFKPELSLIWSLIWNLFIFISLQLYSNFSLNKSYLYQFQCICCEIVLWKTCIEFCSVVYTVVDINVITIIIIIMDKIIYLCPSFTWFSCLLISV